MSAEALTFDAARERIIAGARWSDVAPHLDLADRAELAEWFVHAPGVPSAAVIAERTAAPSGGSAPAAETVREIVREIAPGVVLHSALVPVPTGDACSRCGGLMARTGTCSTCQSCGESSGGCG